MLFDTHAHYDAEQFDGDREAVLAGLVRRGVSLAVNPGCDVPSSRAAVALARAWPFLYAAVGYHPENCAPYDPAELDLFREWAKDPKVVAIGEIGLDYYWEENPPREHQRRVFRDQMALAEELVRLGWMVSFTGVLTYKNARRAVEAARAVPLERIMIETDSPYMAPAPHRGKRNDSGYVRHVCEKLAEIKGISFEECARITLENGKRFYGITE